MLVFLNLEIRYLQHCTANLMGNMTWETMRFCFLSVMFSGKATLWMVISKSSSERWSQPETFLGIGPCFHVFGPEIPTVSWSETIEKTLKIAVLQPMVSVNFPMHWKLSTFTSTWSPRTSRSGSRGRLHNSTTFSCSAAWIRVLPRTCTKCWGWNGTQRPTSCRPGWKHGS